jgi:hypothetical protein
MCYTGLCPYGMSGFGNDGECSIFEDPYPVDAYCMQDHEPPDDDYEWPLESNDGPLF